MGKKINKGDWGGYDIKADQCSGEIRDSREQFSMCCRDRKQCKWCDKGCQGNYKIAGLVERKGDYGDWQVTRYEKCTDSNLNFSMADFITIRGGNHLCCLDVV